MNLRERRKSQRREAIIGAGMELFATAGYGETTVAHIARAAGVSPRTVAGYFPSKVDIAMAPFDDVVADLEATLIARGQGEAVSDVIEAWVRAKEGTGSDEVDVLARRMYARNPEMFGLHLIRIRERGVLPALFAAEIGAAPDDIRTRIGTVAMLAAFMEHHLGVGHDDPDALAVLLRFFRAGVEALHAR